MFAKVDVNGEDADPLFTWLKGEKKGMFGGKVKWKFTKFLVGRDGEVIAALLPHHRAQGHRRRHPGRAGRRRGCMSPWLVLVPIGVLAGFLYFVWQRLAVAPAWRQRSVPYVVALVLIVLTALALAGFDLWLAGSPRRRCGPPSGSARHSWPPAATCILGLGAGVARQRRHLAGGTWPDHGRDARRRLEPGGVAARGGRRRRGHGLRRGRAATPAVTRFEVSSPQLPAEFDGLQVALITDLHAGAVRSAAFTRQVVDLTNAAHPDVVVIAGDLEDGTAARYAPEIAPLADLEAPLGVFVTTGNHEMYQDTANWVTAFEDVGLTVLANTAVPLERDGATITVAGIHDLVGEGEWAPDVDAALGGTDADAFTLFVAHQPLAALDVEGRGVDLQLSGHTHGGQMWPINYLVPLQQPMLEGMATVAGTTVVTSRGAGEWGPPVRVAAPPEVPIVTLRRS